VVDWSYELLDDAERRVFDRAAVFAGGFTLEAAEAVCADSGPVEAGVAGLVARLVDKSLLVADATGEGPRRYLMLETLRVYGLERLDVSGGTGRARQRHTAFFLALAERAGAALHGPKQSAWLARLQTEHGNIRAALEWSIGQGDAVTAARLAGALYQFWDLHGHYTEGRRWLTRVLAMTGPMPPAVRVRALLACGGLAVIQGDLRYAVAAGEEATAVCEEAGDPGGLAHALQFLGFVAIYTEELDRAMELSSRALDSARAANHRWLEGRSLLFLSIAALARGEYNRAAQAAADCAEVLRPVGDADSLAGALVIRATASWRQGDHGAAAAFLRDGLRAYQGLGGLWGLSLGLAVVAYLVGSRGEHQRATVILGASEAVRESIGAVLVPIAKVWHETGIAAAKAALGADAFRRAWEAGQALTPEDAVIEAMKTLDLIGRPATATR
jgi:tetratricopeptide (TPR) repeat protein